MRGHAFGLFAFERDRAFRKRLLRGAGVCSGQEAESLRDLAFGFAFLAKLQSNLDEESAEAFLSDAGANQAFARLTLRAFLDERRGDFASAIGF